MGGGGAEGADGAEGGKGVEGAEGAEEAEGAGWAVPLRTCCPCALLDSALNTSCSSYSTFREIERCI
jgi:hypothetical protein